MNKSLFQTITIVLILALTACGSPTQKVETMPTSEEVKATNEPALPTFELKVMVTDKDGNPITWATGIAQTSGKDVSLKGNDTGQLVLANLSEATGKLTVSAQGYTPSQQDLNLTQGTNELSIKLEKDPLQLDPAKACKPGQKILYVEDFEDGQAQDMNNLVESKWKLINTEDHGMVLSVNSPGGDASTLVDSQFGNGVWLFDMKTSGVIDIDINWHVSEASEGATAGLSRYYITYLPGTRFELNFEKPGERGKLVEVESPSLKEGSWNTFAIAYYKGAISIWVDGETFMDVRHDPPIEKGKFGFQINPDTQAEVQFDNLIVCGLNEPYAP